MSTKTDKAKSFLMEGMLKEALSIIVGFRIGFTKEEKRVLEIAHESLAGNSAFYQKIGIDTEAYINRAEDIIRNKFNI